jgi:hypothetical protein
MNENKSIPESERSEAVKPILKRILEIVATLRNSKLKDKIDYAISFYALIYPWLFSEEELEEKYIEQKSIFDEFNFNGEQLREELKEILDSDEHLKKCCVNEFILSRCFEGSTRSRTNKSDEISKCQKTV